jgi:flagellar protein FliS
MSSAEMAYRETAAASGTGLLIALCDTLAGDLRRAADAERRNEIEQRCRELKHALLVIGHLEHWLDRGSGGELAERLKAFYASLRRRIVVAQAKRTPALLEEQMELVLKIRKEFQAAEIRYEPAGPEIMAPVQMAAYDGGPQAERVKLSWLA